MRKIKQSLVFCLFSARTTRTRQFSESKVLFPSAIYYSEKGRVSLVVACSQHKAQINLETKRSIQPTISIVSTFTNWQRISVLGRYTNTRLSLAIINKYKEVFTNISQGSPLVVSQWKVSLIPILGWPLLNEMEILTWV